MRKRACVFVLILLAATAAWTQDAPSSQDGPMATAPQSPTLQNQAALPRPLGDGTYIMDPAITAPRIVQAAAAVYPADVQTDGNEGICTIRAVIGADGIPAIRAAESPSGDAAIAAAIAAVKESKFEPGRLNDQPIPVRVMLRVVFTADHSPAAPIIIQRRYRDPGQANPLDYPPRPIKIAEAEYSEEARRRKIQGIVVVSTLVNEEGMPTYIRIDKSMGHGLDEKAMEAISQYRFRPATRDGKPVPTRITIDVNFRLY